MSKAPGGGTQDETVRAVAGMGELRSEGRPRYLERLFERLGPGTGVVLGFLLIVVIGGLVSPYFLTQRNITNVLLQTAMLGAVAVGMTFVILTAGIHLSVGTVLRPRSVLAAPPLHA